MTDPRLVEVFGTGRTLEKGKGVVHRCDEEERCSVDRGRYPYTDLATAGVHDDIRLCSKCEWPEGAEEVLSGKD